MKNEEKKGKKHLNANQMERMGGQTQQFTGWYLLGRPLKDVSTAGPWFKSCPPPP